MAFLDRNAKDSQRLLRNQQRLRATGLSAKGDLSGFNNGPARVPVGTDGQLLSADSTQSVGVKWKTVGTFTAKAINVEIDFGATPTYSAVLTITDANVTTTNGIIVNQSGTAATGKSQDENEMDALDLSAVCTVNGQFTLYVTAFPGPVYGKFKINYLLI